MHFIKSSEQAFCNSCLIDACCYCRDIVKKKREDFKAVWRISAQHKKLHARMEDMRKFRYQHEQLRMVIVRVLRPSVHEVVANTEGDEMEPPKQDVFTLDDAADANAIEVLTLKYCH